MKRLKNYCQDRRVYRAYLGNLLDNKIVELKAQNLGHFLHRLAAHLPDEEPEGLTIVCLSDLKDKFSLFFTDDNAITKG